MHYLYEKELAIASNKGDKVLAEVTIKAQAAEKVKASVHKGKNKAQTLLDDIEVTNLTCISIVFIATC